MFIILSIGLIIELKYSPRIETTRERDVLLMYFNSKNNRTYKKLFKF